MFDISDKIMNTLYEIEFQENGTRIETLCKMILFKEKDKKQLHNYLKVLNWKMNMDYYACYNIIKGCFVLRDYHHFNNYLKLGNDNLLKRNMQLFYKIRNEDKKEMIRILLRCRPELKYRTIFRERCYKDVIHKLPSVIIYLMVITNSTVGIRDFINKFILRRGDTYGCPIRENTRYE